MNSIYYLRNNIMSENVFNNTFVKHKCRIFWFVVRLSNAPKKCAHRGLITVSIFHNGMDRRTKHEKLNNLIKTIDKVNYLSRMIKELKASMVRNDYEF